MVPSQTISLQFHKTLLNFKLSFRNNNQYKATSCGPTFHSTLANFTCSKGIIGDSIVSSVLVVVTSHPTDDASRKRSKVIILGAGISGAGAAQTLTEHGITDFIVLEGQSIIGGRMKQGHISGLNIELGANWVEGVGGPQMNPIWSMAQKYNFSVTETSYDDSITIDEYGKIDNSGLRDIFAEKREQATQLMMERKNENLEDISVRNALDLVGWRSTSAFHDCAEYNGVEEEFAGVADLLSASYTLHHDTAAVFGDSMKFVKDQRGYKTIPENIFKETGADKKIVFGAVVSEVIYNDKGVTVKTRNGQTYEADYLISTVSLGVLKNERIKFTPPLPDWKREALAKFRMEIYTKIFLDFPYKFWSNNQFTFYAANEKGYYPEWQNLMAETYMSGLVHPGSNLVLTTLTGAQSRRVERLTFEEVEDEIVEVLEKMYPGKRIPRPTALFFPRWGQDPLFHGSFTNWPIGMTLESWENLVAPLNQKVFFAGEMASRQYFGYVHGGYLAGIKQAENVVACSTHECPQIPYHPDLKAAEQETSFI